LKKLSLHAAAARGDLPLIRAFAIIPVLSRGMLLFSKQSSICGQSLRIAY